MVFKHIVCVMLQVRIAMLYQNGCFVHVVYVMLQCNYFHIPWKSTEHNFHSCCLDLLAVVFRYDRNKLAITATGSPNWIEELEDDFEDMEEDIETYRCTCK